MFVMLLIGLDCPLIEQDVMREELILARCMFLILHWGLFQDFFVFAVHDSFLHFTELLVDNLLILTQFHDFWFVHDDFLAVADWNSSFFATGAQSFQNLCFLIFFYKWIIHRFLIFCFFTDKEILDYRFRIVWNAWWQNILACGGSG